MDKKLVAVDDIIEISVIPVEKLKDSQFITSSRCGTGACVGVARLDNGSVVVQDTKNFSREPLTFSKDEWQAFIEGVKNEEFNV